MNAIETLRQRIKTSDSLVCVGLDPQPEYLREEFAHAEFPLFEFNRWIIQRTCAEVAAYKMNLAFYERCGEIGWRELRMTMEYLMTHHADIFTICDAKRADIPHTSEQYAISVFDELQFDAVTLHPWMGRSALTPFLERTDKVSIIVCRTTNPGADEFQTLIIDGMPLWQYVATNVVNDWNTGGNCMLVVGATHADDLTIARKLAPKMTFLVPGIGAQAGDLAYTVRNGLDSTGAGLLVNSGRSIIYHEQPSLAANQLKTAINAVRAAAPHA